MSAQICVEHLRWIFAMSLLDLIKVAHVIKDGSHITSFKGDE